MGTLRRDAQYWYWDTWPALLISVCNSLIQLCYKNLNNQLNLLLANRTMAPAFFSLLAQWKQVTRWPVLPWIMFPFRGLFSHRLHGFKDSWQSSCFLYLFSVQRLSDCSPMLDIVSWLSELWAKSKNSTSCKDQTFHTFFLYVCVFRSNNWSRYSSSAVRDINSFTFLLSGMAVISDVEGNGLT